MRGSYYSMMRSAEYWSGADRSTQQRITSNQIADYVRLLGKDGGVTMEAIRNRFSAEDIQRAIELHRTIHPVSRETRQGTATFYEAN